jgi:methylated-DNA-protein-cysteine methyltransferase related protein
VTRSPSSETRALRFDRAVHALVRRVPSGAVVTYGQVAALLGVPLSARAVGGAMRRCPPGVPWHRVVNGRGGVSRRANLESVMRQRWLLEREGVRFARGRIDLEQYRWGGRPDASRPAWAAGRL